jgi:hypothetical protein
MKRWIRKLFKKKCRHDYKIVDVSNVIQFDSLGFPLRLYVLRCTKCGNHKQEWIDSFKGKGDVVCKWRELGPDDVEA